MIGKLLCAIGLHKLELYRKVNEDICELMCERCEDKFGKCKSTQTTIPLDEELRREHDRLVLVEYFKGN